MAEANGNPDLSDFGFEPQEEEAPTETPDESLEDEVDSDEEVDEEEVLDDEDEEEDEEDEETDDEEDEEPEPKISKSEQRRRDAQAKQDKLQSDLKKANDQLLREQLANREKDDRLAALEARFSEIDKAREQAEEAALSDFGEDDDDLLTVKDAKRLRALIEKKTSKPEVVSPPTPAGPSVYDQQVTVLKAQPDIDQVSAWVSVPANKARVDSLPVPPHDLISSYHAVKAIMAEDAAAKKAKTRNKKNVPRTGGAAVDRSRGKSKSQLSAAIDGMLPKNGRGGLFG